MSHTGEEGRLLERGRYFLKQQPLLPRGSRIFVGLSGVGRAGRAVGEWPGRTAAEPSSSEQPAPHPRAGVMISILIFHPWASLSQEQTILGLSQFTYLSDPTDDGFSVLERALQEWGLDETCQNAFPEPLIISL